MAYEMDIKKMEHLAMVKCWGMAELQRQAGLAGTTIYKIKIGQHKASARTVGKLARALGCDPMELIKA